MVIPGNTSRRLVPIPVPPVRPLTRRSFKRFLRLLPSLLLLLFVVSLIFVTLTQIAVIHSSRQFAVTRISTSSSFQSSSGQQTHYSQQQPNHVRSPDSGSLRRVNQLQPFPAAISTIFSSSSLSSSSSSSSSSSTLSPPIKKDFTNNPLLACNSATLTPQEMEMFRKKKKKKLKPLEIEAFWDKTEGSSFLSPESNINSVVSSSSGDGKQQFSGLSESGQNSSFSSLTMSESSDVSNISSFLKGNEVSEFQLLLSDKNHYDGQQHKSECPLVPPNLVGKVSVDIDLTEDNESLEEQRFKENGLQDGGSWEPQHCTARHKVAIIIPYRDRRDHLHALLHHLHPILQRQLISYRIFVVEQYGNDTFNKGVLMNGGVKEALKLADFNCFIFHDVDLIPEDDRNLYSCPSIPRHMSVAVDKFNYTLPYPYLVGGVFAISKAHFVLVNGYSNLYWGWGGEDDDMAHRLKLHDLKTIRPPESIGRYTMIKHQHRPESPNNVRTALLRMAKRRANRDGFNSVRYKIVSQTNESLFTHMMIEIDPIHKWIFPSPNKLVIHFKK